MRSIKSRRELAQFALRTPASRPSNAVACRSEETPRPAKRPRRKAGARAKRGVSELCFHYTIDEHTSCRSDSDQLQNQARF